MVCEYSRIPSGTPCAHQPWGPGCPNPDQLGVLWLVAKWQNPKTNLLIALLGWDVPHPTA